MQSCNYYKYLCVLLWVLLVFNYAYGIPIDNVEIESVDVTRNSLPFEDCGTEPNYDIYFVRISSCMAAPCTIRVNETVSVTTEFTMEEAIPVKPVDKMHGKIFTHEAFWILNGVTTKAAISPDHCDGNMCPFLIHDTYGFTVELQAGENLPAIRGTLYWRVSNAKGDLAMCFKVPISLIY